MNAPKQGSELTKTDVVHHLFHWSISVTMDFENTT